MDSYDRVIIRVLNDRSWIILMSKTVIYARTSTVDQNVNQQAELLSASYPNGIVHMEQQSGKGVDRPVLEAVLVELSAGDCLVVYDLSRLSRNTTDFLLLLEELDQREVGLIIHNMGGQPVDSRSAVGKMILTVLSATATMERELMLEKQAIGISTAKAAGKYKGKQVNPKTVEACKEAVKMVEMGISKEKAAKANGIGVATLYRYLKKAG